MYSYSRCASATLLAAFVAVGIFVSILGAPVVKGPKEASLIRASIVRQLAIRTNWPESRLSKEVSTFVIALVGKDEFGTASFYRKRFNGAALHGREVELLVSENLESILPEVEERCHLLYVLGDRSVIDEEQLQALASLGILTVGEWRRFTDFGGMVSISTPGGRAGNPERRINLDDTQSAGFEIGTDFLRHAKVLRKGKRR